MVQCFKRSVLWDIMVCSPLKVNQHFRGTLHLHLYGPRINQARKQHEAGSKQISETFVGFQQITQFYIPQDWPLHNDHFENLKSYIVQYFIWEFFHIL